MANFQEGVGLTVSGKTTWAQLTEASGPNKFSNKYQVELTLDEDSINKLKAVTSEFDLVEFLDIKTKEGEKKYDSPTIRLKTNSMPRVWGMDKQPFTGYINNGSFISARIFIKAWEMAGKKGLTAYINEAAVLVPAADNATASGPSDELFKAKAPAADAATPAAFSPVSTTNDLPF